MARQRKPSLNEVLRNFDHRADLAICVKGAERLAPKERPRMFRPCVTVAVKRAVKPPGIIIKHLDNLAYSTGSRDVEEDELECVELRLREVRSSKTYAEVRISRFGRTNDFRKNEPTAKNVKKRKERSMSPVVSYIQY